jgi:hypothetical protein
MASRGDKKKGSNFTGEETDLPMALVGKHNDVIENKKKWPNDAGDEEQHLDAD